MISSQNRGPQARLSETAYMSAANKRLSFDCFPWPKVLNCAYSMFANNRNSLQCHCKCACRMPRDGARGLGEELCIP